MPNWSIGYTPIFMVYKAKAVLPTNLYYGSPCIRVYDKGQLEEARQDAMDQLKEARDIALLR